MRIEFRYEATYYQDEYCEMEALGQGREDNSRAYRNKTSNWWDTVTTRE